MDALSHLLSLYPIRTALDTRCRSAVAYSMDHVGRAHGIAPYHLIAEGQAMLHMPGQAPLPLVAGDMLVLPRGQAHTLHIGAQGHMTDILCGQFDVGDAAASKMISALPVTILIRTAGKNEFSGLQALANLLRDEAGVTQPGAQAVIGHLASALFALILRAWMKHADAVPGLFALLANQRLVPVFQHMLMAPEKNWSLPQLAQLSNMSRATFLRNFRRVADSTPGELLTHIRMAQAALWLREAHRSVAEIGAAVGYQSEAAFSKAFKRYMGDGPGHYRRAAALLH